MFGVNTSVQYNMQGWDGALDFNWGGEAGAHSTVWPQMPQLTIIVIENRDKAELQ